MKKKQIHTTYILLCALLLSSFVNAQTPVISGPNNILPDLSVNYSAALPSNVSNIKWTSNCPSLSFATINSAGTWITVPKSSICCSIILTLSYTLQVTTVSGTATTVSNVAQTPITKTIKLLPHIAVTQNGNPVTAVYPGETFQVQVKHSGGAGCPLCTQSGIWSFSGANCIGPCNTVNESFSVLNSGFSSNVTIDHNYNCPSFNQALSQVILPVKLRDPSFVSPLTSIGCSNSPPLTSASVVYATSAVVGAAYYVWTWPPSLFNATNPNNVNGSSISLDPIGLGSGNITVQAFDSNGGAVSSNIVISPPITICCLPIKTLSGVVNSGNSPYTEEAELVINTTNDITSSGSATIHAGDEVRLNPGFNAASGCQVHIYNQGCSGSFYRSLPHDSSNIITLIHLESLSTEAAQAQEVSVTNIDNENQTLKSPDLVSASNFEMKIVPNPSKDKFQILVSGHKNMPNYLEVYNYDGQRILSFKPNDNNILMVDLTLYKDGIYYLKLNFEERVESRILIKQNN